jgi:hypothetical protein
MVDGLHMPIWKRTIKPLTISLSEVGRRLRGIDNGSNVNNVQHKSNQNCHYEYPPDNKYILIKNFKNNPTNRFIVYVNTQKNT